MSEPSDRPIVTIGEILAVFITTEATPLEFATRCDRQLAGAESNVKVGLARLGGRASFIGVSALMD